MTCQNAMLYTSLYLDGELDAELEKELLEHLKDCSMCKKEFEDMKTLLEMLHEIEQVELPEGFHDELVQKLQSSKQTKGTIFEKFSWKTYSAMVAALLFLFIVGSFFSSGNPLGSLGGSSSSQNEAPPPTLYSIMDTEEYAGEENRDNGVFEGEYHAGAGSSNEQFNDAYRIDSGAADTNLTKQQNLTAFNDATADDSRKRIKILNLVMEVEDFGLAMEQIQGSAESKGGYTESFSSYVYRYDEETGVTLKNGYIGIKVPKNTYESLKNLLWEYGKIVDENEQTTDVANQHVQSEGLLKSKQQEEERLLS